MIVRELEARQTELGGVDRGVVTVMIELENEFTSNSNEHTVERLRAIQNSRIDMKIISNINEQF